MRGATAQHLKFHRRAASGSVTVNDFGNVSRTRVDGISRTLETELILTSSGQGDGGKIGATLEGIQAKTGGDVDYSDCPTRDTNQSGDGLISVYYAYEDNSQLLALRDDDGNTTAYLFDNQNRTTVERKGLAFNGTTFAISGGDAGRFVVALRGGVSPVDTESAGTDIAFGYDADSNRVARTDEAGNVMSCFFDGLNREKSCVIARASGFIGTSAQTHKFDGLSRQTECLDNNDPATTGDDLLCQYFFESLSRKVEEDQKIGSGTKKAASCNFDIAAGSAIGSPTACFYPDGRRVDSTFDALDRLVSKRDNGQSSDIGKYEYMGSWRVALLTYQNETRLTHLNGTADSGFDSLRRIRNHRWEAFTAGDTTPGNDTLVVGFEHQDSSAASLYDRANNKRIEFKSHDTTQSEQYKYDSAYRLASPASGSQGQDVRAFERGAFTDGTRSSMAGGVAFFQDLDLEGVGNWVREDDNARVETRNHSDFNELNQRTVSAQNSGLTYDKNGNTLDTGNVSVGGQNFPGGGLRMEWDALNRLRKVYKNNNTPGSTGDDSQVAEHMYDCMNRRFRKIVTNSGSLNGTTDYYYEGWRVVEEHDAADAVTLQYVWGNYLDEAWSLDKRSGGITIAQLNDASGQDRLFYHQNTLYSIFGLTDETGALKEAYQYDAYGLHTVIADGNDGDTIVNFNANDVRTVGGTPGFSNVLTYTGQRLDPEANGVSTDGALLFFKNRFYLPSLGRFVGRDIVRSLNRYNYVLNRCTRFSDPFGNDGGEPDDPDAYSEMQDQMLNDELMGMFNATFDWFSRLITPGPPPPADWWDVEKARKSQIGDGAWTSRIPISKIEEDWGQFISPGDPTEGSHFEQWENKKTGQTRYFFAEKRYDPDPKKDPEDYYAPITKATFEEGCKSKEAAKKLKEMDCNNCQKWNCVIETDQKVVGPMETNPAGTIGKFELIFDCSCYLPFQAANTLPECNEQITISKHFKTTLGLGGILDEAKNMAPKLAEGLDKKGRGKISEITAGLGR